MRTIRLAGLLAIVVTTTALAEPVVFPVPIQDVVDGMGGVEGLYGSQQDVAVSPDGLHLYACANGDNAVAAFSIDSLTGQLTFVEAEIDGVGGVDGLEGVTRIAISPDGAHVYAASTVEDAVAVFSRDAGTGALTFVERVSFFASNGWVVFAISPDGANVYVSGLNTAFEAFARDAVTGELTTLGTVTGLQSGEDVGAILISPDGLHVYTVSYKWSGYFQEVGGKVTAFSRDAMTGALDLIGQVGEGQPPAAMRPDGTEIYTTDLNGSGYGGDGLVVHSRDLVSGALTEVQVLPELMAPNLGAYVNRPYGLTAASDGSHVYFLTSNGDIIVMRRDAMGLLSVRHRWNEPPFGNGIVVALRPDDSTAYVGRGAGLRAFALETADCDPVPRGTCRQVVQSGKSRLTMKTAPASSKNTFSWSWTHGEATASGDFGNPFVSVGGTDYAACVYDGSGGTQPMVTGIAPRAGDCKLNRLNCWSRTPSFGPVIEKIKYRDKERHDGLSLISLTPGIDEQAKFKVKGSGPSLPLPATFVLPLRAQLQNSDGECWEAVFSTASANTGGLFIATSD